MKRLMTLPMILGLTLACSFANVTQNPPPTETEPASVSQTSSITENSPAAAQTLLYISGTTHIETNRQTWPNVDALLSFLQQVTDLGMHWSIGADIGWLEGEPRAAELIQKSEAMGVQWDIHVHNVGDRAKAAYLITQMGGHPTTVMSGMLFSEVDTVTQPTTHKGLTWTIDILWGGTNCPGHRPGCDDKSVGVNKLTDSLIRVGGGSHQLEDGRVLAQSIANGEYEYPVISYTVMVAPVSLTVVNSDDDITEIATFVKEMNRYGFVRWATIEETAQAWVAAGSVPSQIAPK